MKVKDLVPNIVGCFQSDRVVVVNDNGTYKFDDIWRHYDDEVYDFIEAKEIEDEDIILVLANSKKELPKTVKGKLEIVKRKTIR